MLQSLVAAASHNLIDYLTDPNLLLTTLIASMGGWMILVVALIVFIESGVLFPVLPGDTMIFALGILHSSVPNVPLWVTFTVLVLAGIAGNIVGYWLGGRFGRGLFKEGRRFLSPAHLHDAEVFFDKYGGPALVIARFVPFVRTFVPLVAGMVRYDYKRFLWWNIVGSIGWIFSFLAGGALLGGIAVVRENVGFVAIAMLMVSVVPMAWALIKKLAAKVQAWRVSKRG